jgi:hypothetical protein
MESQLEQVRDREGALNPERRATGYGNEVSPRRRGEWRGAPSEDVADANAGGTEGKLQCSEAGKDSRYTENHQDKVVLHVVASLWSVVPGIEKFGDGKQQCRNE